VSCWRRAPDIAGDAAVRFLLKADLPPFVFAAVGIVSWLKLSTKAAVIFFETFAAAPRHMFAERINFLPLSGRFGVTKKAMGGSSRGRRSALFFCPNDGILIVPLIFERTFASALVTAGQLFALILQSRIDKRHTLC